MKCRQSEELWSDYVERTLPTPLGRDLDEHLESCNGCARLFATFREVVEALSSLPHPQPDPGLVECILRTTRPRLGHRDSQPGWILPGLPLPKWGNWALGTAAVALAVVLVLQPPAGLSAFGDRINQWGHRTYSFGLRAYRGSERLIDELNVLRMAVGVAFEDRLDRINERLKDLEEARRKSEVPAEPSSHLQSPRQLTRYHSTSKNPVARSLL